nr:ribbon-helix-helix protein, CopG family [uncultured Rhodopila sp.]
MGSLARAMLDLGPPAGAAGAAADRLTIASELPAKLDAMARKMGQSRAALIKRAICQPAERMVS